MPQSSELSVYEAGASRNLVIDCHGHYTTEPPELFAWRKRQIDAIANPSQMPSIESLSISDDQLRNSVEGAQLRLQNERGISLTLISPRASGMGHHIGNAEVSAAWARVSNDLIFRLTRLFPNNFAGVCQLPQSPRTEPRHCIAELQRCVEELGFVGCNLNPDPTGGYWTDPPLSDRSWYPLYEKMVELDVPAMVHVSASANRSFHTTACHYLNGDTTAFVQFLMSDLFRDFPTLRFVIPHGGGAIPYHWGRFRGIAQDQKRPPLSDSLLQNVYFDTCVYHQPGIDLLTRVIPHSNILFASETLGAVKGLDPESGFNFDDTRRYIESATGLTTKQKQAIFCDNALRVYPRLRCE